MGLQERQTSELRETSFILHPLRCTNKRIMRDILHFTSSKMHKRANYARHSSFSTPSRDTNERTTRDILHFTSSKMHKRTNYMRHPSFFVPQETQTSELCETFLI